MTISPQEVGDGRHNVEGAVSTISYRCRLTAVTREWRDTGREGRWDGGGAWEKEGSTEGGNEGGLRLGR